MTGLTRKEFFLTLLAPLAALFGIKTQPKKELRVPIEDLYQAQAILFGGKGWEWIKFHKNHIEAGKKFDNFQDPIEDGFSCFFVRRSLGGTKDTPALFASWYNKEWYAKTVIKANA